MLVPDRLWRGSLLLGVVGSIALLGAACGPQPPLTGTDSEGDEVPADDTIGPLTVTFTGDTVGDGVVRGDDYECRITFDGAVTGGSGSGSITWQSGLATFEAPDAAPGTFRARSGWSADFVRRFFGLRTVQVDSPTDMKGGPYVFADNSGEPFVLVLDFTYLASDATDPQVVRWRYRCR